MMWMNILPCDNFLNMNETLMDEIWVEKWEGVKG